MQALILVAAAPVVANAALVYYAAGEVWLTDKHFAMVSSPYATEISFPVQPTGAAAAYFAAGNFALASLELVTSGKGNSTRQFDLMIPAALMSGVQVTPISRKRYEISLIADIDETVFFGMPQDRFLLIADFQLLPEQTPEPRTLTLAAAGLTLLSLTANRRRRRRCAVSCGPARK